MRNLLIDAELASYETFLDYAWAREIESRCNGSRIHDIVIGTFLALKKAAAASSLPWIMHKSLHSQAEGFLSVPSGCHEWITLLRQRLEREIGHILSPAKQKALFELLYRIDREILQATTMPPSNYEYNIDELFQKNATEPEFAFSLSATQEQCLCFLFAAYEHFIVRIYETIKHVSDYQTGTKSEKEFVEAFGARAADFCWSSNEITFIKQCRNAIVHDGGKITNRRLTKLSPLNITYDSIDGHLVIRPKDVRWAYSVIKERITRLVDTVLALP